MKQVVRCFLENSEGKYLLVKHISGTHWTLPGGHIDEGETLHEALHREIMEEFNLEIAILGKTQNLEIENISELPSPLSIYEIEYKSKKWGQIKKQEYIFLAEVLSGELRIQEDEIADYKWFTKNEILNEEMTFEQIKQILKNIN